ncbi:tetratricopeptide repeat protein [Candidatus Dependentiae bacterium]|nr:tetratricopeptide repeat protein [Candidatus Dependentiae bacterium]
MSFLKNLQVKTLFNEFFPDMIMEGDRKNFLQLEIYLRTGVISEFIGELKKDFTKFKNFRFDLNSKSENIYLKALAEHNYSYYSGIFGEYQNAKIAVDNAVKLIKNKKQTKSLKLLFLNDYALLEYFKGNFKASKDIFEKVLKLLKKENNYQESIFYRSTMNRLGVAYRNLGEYNKAKKIFLELLIFLKGTKQLRQMAIVYNNLSNIPIPVITEKQLLEYSRKGYKIFKKIGEQLGEALYFSKLSHYYYKHEDFEKSIKNNLKSLEIFKSIDNRRGIFIENFNITLHLILIGDLNFAEKFIFNSLKTLDIDNEYDRTTFLLLNEYLNMYRKKESFNPENLFKIRDKARTQKWQHIIVEINDILAQFYAIKKQLDKLYELLKEKQINTSLDLAYYFLYLSLLEVPKKLSKEKRKYYLKFKDISADPFFHYCSYKYFSKIDFKLADYHLKLAKKSIQRICKKFKKQRNIRNYKKLWFIEQIFNQ